MDRDRAAALMRKCIPEAKRTARSAKEADRLEKWSRTSSSSSSVEIRNLCRLWGGMGYVYEVSLSSDDKDDESEEGKVVRVVVKSVRALSSNKNASRGDRRKADSYVVEANFYERAAPWLREEKGLDVPTPYHVERSEDGGVVICMSRLEGSSSSGADDPEEETRAVLDWLAALHAATWGDDVAERHGLQPVGTYWHLGTRPDEHASMPNRGWKGRLKRAARAIDGRLERDPMRCCVHGDAKEANMIFRRDDEGRLRVSMCDFQYCGAGPPTKDLAYFLCVAAHDTDPRHVQYYHRRLSELLPDDARRPTLHELNESLQLAYCDWTRFMIGWGFWGADIKDEVTAVLDRLDGGTLLDSEDDYEEAVRREFG